MRDLSSMDDNELVSLSLEDQASFAYLIDRYESRLLSYIRKITQITMPEAEDILQDVFIKVYYNLNEFDNSLSFSSWIYRIAHNEVISAHRKKSVRAEGNSWSIDTIDFDYLRSKLDTSDLADTSILRSVIEKVFKDLDRVYSDVLILRFFEEKDYKEISDILKKPMGTVATLLNRAKKSFRNEAQRLNIDISFYE